MRKLTPEQRSFLEEATARYEKSIDVALPYLASRGFAEETVRSNRLGVVVEPLPGDERYVDHLHIPYLTRAGVVSGRFRRLSGVVHQSSGSEDDHPRYCDRPGGRTHLYNTAAFFRDEPFICITEGELDALSLHQIGYPAVGVSGANKWRPVWQRIFEDYGRIYIFGDGDTAGRKFARDVSDKTHGLVIDLPDGYDINSLMVDPEYGPEWFEERLGGDGRAN